jgi:hypothetical protein
VIPALGKHEPRLREDLLPPLPLLHARDYSRFPRST